jgi:hypothetical protein
MCLDGMAGVSVWGVGGFMSVTLLYLLCDNLLPLPLISSFFLFLKDLYNLVRSTWG